ncbi:MAG: transposase [Phycisphaerales bacterium]|nr:MAG: transposase [Phycisphaerales bacterium]
MTSRCTSGLPFRELDEAFRLTEQGSILLSDPRQGKNTQHTMLAMLQQSVYGRLTGYEDVNDPERLRIDRTMRRVVGGRAKEREAASTSEMSRVETEMLTTRKNLKSLMDVPGKWIDRVRQGRSLDKLIFDLNPGAPGVSETYERRERAAAQPRAAASIFRVCLARPRGSTGAAPG